MIDKCLKSKYNYSFRFPVDDLIEKGLSPSQQTAASPAGPFDIPPSPRTVTDHLSCDIPATEQKPSTDSDKADIADTETVQSTVHTDEQGEVIQL